MNKKYSFHGPRGLPILGSVIQYGRNPFTFLKRLRSKYGNVAQYKLFNDSFVAVFSPEHVEWILIKNAANYRKGRLIRETWEPLLGRGLVSAEGDDWKRARKALQPYLSKDKLKKYFELVLLESESYAESVCVNKKLVINKEMMKVFLHMLVKLFFRIDMEESQVKRFGKLFDDCCAYFTWSVGPGLLFDRFPNPMKKRFLASAKELGQLTEEIINSKEELPAQNILSTLKSARDEHGSPFEHKYIIDNILTFFLAGHETSALTTSYALYLLANHPDEILKVQKELDEVIGVKPFTFEMIDQLKALKNVVHETLRLYPGVGLMTREAVGEDQIDGIHVKAGTNIILPVFVIQRDPSLFENGDEFRPDRWNGKENERAPGFIPFGQGSRICIGANLAELEVITILSVLLKRFDIKLHAPRKLYIVPSITFRPKNDIVLEFSQRTFV